jgi:hypothetical protein
MLMMMITFHGSGGNMPYPYLMLLSPPASISPMIIIGFPPCTCPNNGSTLEGKADNVAPSRTFPFPKCGCTTLHEICIHIKLVK